MKIYRLSELTSAIKGRQNCKIAVYGNRDVLKISPEMYAELKERNIQLVLVNTRPKPEEL